MSILTICWTAIYAVFAAVVKTLIGPFVEQSHQSLWDRIKRWFAFTPQALAYCVKRLPKNDEVQGKYCVVCKDGEFKLATSGELPQKLEHGEVCWILPENEINVSVSIPDGERILRLQTRLQFQPDRCFAEFAAGKTELTEKDLFDLVLAAWNSLNQEQPYPSDFTAAQNENIRAALSSLLQLNGFRCTGFAGSRIDANAATAEPLPEKETEKVRGDLEIVLATTSPDKVAGQLEAAGFNPLPEEKRQLQTTIDALRRNRQTAKESAAVITEMLLAGRNRKYRLETERYWNADAVKARIENNYGASLTPIYAPKTDVPADRKRPWLLFTFQQSAVDAKLTAFLSANVGDWQTMIQDFESQSHFRLAAVLLPVKQTVERLRQHIETLPRLTGKHSSLQKQQVPLKETVAAVQRAVPLAQTAGEQLRQLLTSELPQERFAEQCGTVLETLTKLETEIQKRKDIYA
jgi:hypothetical protein